MKNAYRRCRRWSKRQASPWRDLEAVVGDHYRPYLERANHREICQCRSSCSKSLLASERPFRSAIRYRRPASCLRVDRSSHGTVSVLLVLKSFVVSRLRPGQSASLSRPRANGPTHSLSVFVSLIGLINVPSIYAWLVRAIPWIISQRIAAIMETLVFLALIIGDQGDWGEGGGECSRGGSDEARVVTGPFSSLSPFMAVDLV
jgi:hypothetical protein